jgi:microcystin-dependent protein
MSDPYIGQITMFAGNFAPKGYAFCNGQLMSINQNQALFSLLGTTYGGDGRATFGLPNLQSRLPVHYGKGNGLSNYALGEIGGAPSVTLTLQTMPAHNHSLMASRSNATTGTIGPAVVPAVTTGSTSAKFYATQGAGQPPLDPAPLDGAACGTAGGSQAHGNLMPSMAISFIIATDGTFPSRN